MNPAKGFGENHVLLGGMISPESATLIKSLISTGNIENPATLSS